MLVHFFVCVCVCVPETSTVWVLAAEAEDITKMSSSHVRSDHRQSQGRSLRSASSTPPLRDEHSDEHSQIRQQSDHCQPQGQQPNNHQGQQPNTHQATQDSRSFQTPRPHRFNRDQVRCFVCHKLGHYAQNCPDAVQRISRLSRARQNFAVHITAQMKAVLDSGAEMSVVPAHVVPPSAYTLLEYLDLKRSKNDQNR